MFRFRVHTGSGVQKQLKDLVSCFSLDATARDTRMKWREVHWIARLEIRTILNQHFYCLKVPESYGEAQRVKSF